ncbi:MAG TPA: hypothetical protein VK060_08135 [Ruania sp.]|nr:hypothetical protein [Ruania sp.]
MAKRGAVGPAAITLIVIDVLLVAALVVIMATWPDATSTEGATGSATADAPAANGTNPSEGEETTQAEAVEVPDGTLEVAGFIMPSGNIWCEIGDESTQCVIEGFEFSPPPLEDCSEDVAGHVWQVTADQAGPACPGEAVPEAPDDLTELAYGDATTVGDFLCESTRDGVVCRAISTGHGFEIARGGTRSF